MKVSIIDDHPIVLEGLKNMLNAFSEFEVEGTYLCFESLMKGLKEHLPDVLLLDIQMPGKSGDEMLPELLSTFPCLKIIALTNVNTLTYVHNMLKFGVKGYLLKTSEPGQITEAIKSVCSGQEIIDPSLTEAYREFTMNMKRASYLKPKLTTREKEIAQLIALGYSSQEIGNKLFISIRTVEFYRLNIMTKLDVNNAAALVHKAFSLGIIL